MSFFKLRWNLWKISKSQLRIEAVVKAVAQDQSREIPTGNDWIEACNQRLVAQFIQRTNAHYKSYFRCLWHSYLDGDDLYHATVHEAYNILQRREEKQPHYINKNHGVSFTQGSQPKRDMSNILCYIAVTRWGITPTQHKFPSTALRSPTKSMKMKNYLEVESITRRR